MDITTLPRELINLNLRAARLPLTAFELVARRGQDAALWPPAIAFESAEATVRETLGGLLRDETLVADARLQRVRVNELRHALESKAAAVEKQAEADQQYQQRKAQMARQQETVEQRADERQRDLDKAKADAKRKVAEDAARKKEAADKAARQRAERLRAEERVAETRRLHAEAVALKERERALAAEKKVVRIDGATKATKQLRTGS